MIQRIKNKFIELQDDPHLREVAHGTIIAFILKVVGASLAFIFNVVLARLLGADGAGIYFLSLSIITIASVVSRVGLDNTLLRYVAAGASEQNWVEVKGIYTKAMIITIPLSILITVLVELSTFLLSIDVFDKPELEDPLRWMALAIMPLSLLSLYAEMLKGLKKITASLTLQGVVLPFVNLCVLMLVASSMDVVGGSISYVVASLVTASMGIWLWTRYVPGDQKYCMEFGWKPLIESCLPNYGVALLHKALLPWLPLLLLGLWASSEDVGLYSAAVRTAMLISFILLAVNSVVAPKFAALHRQNDMAALGILARKTTWLTTLIMIPVILPIIIFPEIIMSAFGQEFRQAWLALIVLSAGQFINVVFGPVGYLLVMTGNEAMQKNSVFMSAIMLSIFLVSLVPSYGVLGAAIATSVSGVFFNVISYRYVKKHLGFSTFIISQGNRG